MFRFQHGEYFWFLLLIPVLVLCYFYFLAWKKSRIKRIGDPALVKNLILGKINGRLTTKLVLVSLALICLIIGLANLQAGGHPEKTDRKGLDVMFVLDVSNSMLAQDIAPNRLEKAKELIYRVLNQLKTDRTGLVVFAGNAYLQVPLTTDYGAMKMLLANVNPEMIPTQGTNFSDALQMADDAFPKKGKQSKVIILISDGEDHDDQAVNTAKSVGKDGVVIYTVGIGSPQGSTIFDPSTGKPKVDRNGNIIITKLNEDELRNISGPTGGKYQLLQNSGAVANGIANAIGQMSTQNLGTVVYTDYTSYFQYFIGGALILLIFSWLLPDARKIEGRTTGKTKSVGNAGVLPATLLTIGLILLSGNPLMAQRKTEVKPPRPTLKFKKSINSGNQSYHQQQFSSALKAYQNALKQNPESFTANFNQGDALYQSGKFEAARNSMLNSLKAAATPEEKAIAYHNIGNAFMKEKKWQEAVDAYKKSLLQNPTDRDTKYNLAYAQMMLKKNGGGGKNNKNQNKQDQNKQDQNKQDQNKQDQNKQNQNKQDQNKQDQNKQDRNKQGQDKKDQDQQNGQKDQQDQRPQGQPSKLSKEQADNILNALNQEEQQLHKNKKNRPGTPVKPEKDW